MGKCRGCGKWNTLVEELGTNSGARVQAAAPPGRAPGKAIPVTEVRMDQSEIRLQIGIGELDRVLGGGLVKGALTLIGGDPGVGKSTLLLATMHAISTQGVRVLYVSGEESARQVRLRAERLGTLSPELYLLAETDLDTVQEAVNDVKPQVLVLDSVQTLHRSSMDSGAGSMLQVREVANTAMKLAKGREISTFLIGHVTKEGNIAGPRVLEHLVDTVLYLEGDGSTGLRILRAVKNRFGSTGEIGLFEMRDSGLAEVPDASARLLEERAMGAPGTVVTCSMEGARPLLVEIQALVGRPTQGNPTRNVVGLDRTRLSMILAVLGRLGLDLNDRDVFVSAAGGVRVLEPAADLAIAIAIHSSCTSRPVPPELVAFGEIGLVGEVRGVSMPMMRLREAERHGFSRAMVPASVREASGLDLELCRTLREVLGD